MAELAGERTRETVGSREEDNPRIGVSAICFTAL